MHYSQDAYACTVRLIFVNGIFDELARKTLKSWFTSKRTVLFEDTARSRFLKKLKCGY